MLFFFWGGAGGGGAGCASEKKLNFAQNMDARVAPPPLNVAPVGYFLKPTWEMKALMEGENAIY